MADEETIKGPPKERSPAYPYIALDQALDRAEAIYKQVRTHAQPREVVAKAYGKPLSSSATQQTFSTLIQYGLLENVSSAAGRKLRVTQLAQTLFHPHAPKEKIAEGRKTAALSPPIFLELWVRYGDAADINESIPLYYLTVDRGAEQGAVFTDKAAKDVLRIYRATLAFAGLKGDGSVQEPPEEAAEDDPSPPLAVKVGDLAQAEVNGALQFSKPKRVEEIVQHDGESWVYFEGETAAVPMSQVTPVEQGGREAPAAPPTRVLPPAGGGVPEGWSEENLIDDAGSEIKIRYLGKASVERYEFIRDYLDFKIKRLKKSPAPDPEPIASQQPS